jgi:flagellar biogenesis protein FliO
MKLFLTLSLFLFSNFTFSSPKYEVIGLGVVEKQGRFEIEVKLSANTHVRHEVEVRDNFIQIELRDTFVWPKIDQFKRIKEYGKVELQAYQFNSKTVRVRAIFEDANYLKGVVVKVNKLRGNLVASAELSKSKLKQEISTYDESYLNKLLKEKKAQENIVVEKEISDDVFFGNSAQKKQKRVDPLAAPDANQSDKKDMSGYILKFFGFLLMLLAFIYACVFFLKKGYVKKNKLGFLNSSELIKVLATHHVDPKKSLMIVSAGKQVFLLSSHENGISKLSELDDPMSYFKEGEVNLFGSNFDDSIEKSKEERPEFKVKEDIEKSSPVSLSDTSITSITDKIKNRVKGMKDYQ